MSTVVNLAAVTSVGFLDSSEVADVNVPLWFPAIIGAEHLTLYPGDVSLANKYSLTQAGLLSAHLLTKSSPTVTLLPFNMYIKTAMFSTYETYKMSRSHAAEGVYPWDLNEYSIRDLSVAPFKKENLVEPIFYIPAGLSAIFQIANMMGSEDAIWKTGKTYVDNKEIDWYKSVPVVTGINMLNNIATAVGEEALYRGVIYEELKVSYGSRKAKLIDFFLFPGIHVPQDIARGLEPGNITGLFLMRGFSTLLFDYAYDKGGLPLSVSLHTWLNMIGYTTRWLGSAGSPIVDDLNASNSLTPSMSIGFTYRF